MNLFKDRLSETVKLVAAVVLLGLFVAIAWAILLNLFVLLWWLIKIVIIVAVIGGFGYFINWLIIEPFRKKE